MSLAMPSGISAPINRSAPATPPAIPMPANLQGMGQGAYNQQVQQLAYGQPQSQMMGQYAQSQLMQRYLTDQQKLAMMNFGMGAGPVTPQVVNANVAPPAPPPQVTAPPMPSPSTYGGNAAKAAASLLSTNPLGPEKAESNFDSAAYLKANPDVANPNLWSPKNTAYQHYVLYGQQEGRPFPQVAAAPMPSPAPVASPVASPVAAPVASPLSNPAVQAYLAAAIPNFGMGAGTFTPPITTPPFAPPQAPQPAAPPRNAYLDSLTPAQRAMLGDGNRGNNRQLTDSLSRAQLALRDQWRGVKNSGLYL